MPLIIALNRSFEMEKLPGRIKGLTYIYALLHPTGAVRYIGKTDNPMRRYQHHLQPWDSKTHKSFWIRKLLRDGIKPVMVILEVVKKTNWRQSEVRWIRRFRSRGFDLVNSTDGGDGSTGFKHTDETRKKIKMSQKGRVRLEETKLKISNTLKGHTVSEESRALIRASLTGRTATEASRKLTGKTSKASWAKLTPGEHEARRAKMMAGRKPWTPEMKAALSAKKRQAVPGGGKIPGVRFNPKTGRWQAEITIAGVRTHLGSFGTKGEAKVAREFAEPGR
jgi:group I intron endonuclease